MGTVFVAVVTVALLALIAGLALSYAARTLPPADDGLVEQVNDLLPQTQCAQCGFPGCRPYARAIVEQNAATNLCPPGGEETALRLAELLGREPLPLSTPGTTQRVIAVIDESRCIGCLHCRNACPVDAIVGAQHRMHTIIATECTGCELCVAPCPVDCISLQRVA